MDTLLSASFLDLPIQVLIPMLFIVFMMGASLGSFLAAAVYRATKSHRSIFLDRSECTSCGRKLSALDLVPLFSFLFLGAKCRTCKKPISWRYFLIELSSAIIVTAIIFNSGFSLDSLGKIVASLVLFAILIIDLDTWLIPTSLPVFLIGWGFLIGVVAPLGFDLFDRVLGAILGFGVLAAVLIGATLLLRRSGRLKKDEWAMGWGDPVLMASIGSMVGYVWLLLVLWIACIQAIAAYLILRLRRHNFAHMAKEAHAEQEFEPPENALPLGTFLCLAGIEILIAASFLGL